MTSYIESRQCDWRVYHDPECPGYDFFYGAYLFSLAAHILSVILFTTIVGFRVTLPLFSYDVSP